MNFLYLIVVIVTIISIYSLGSIFWVVTNNKYSDLSQYDLKSNRVYSVSQVQRVFTPYEHEFPCYEEKNVKRGKKMKGLIYIKVPKAASSTLAGINLRIAHRHMQKTNKLSMCSASYLHKKAKKFKVWKRDRKKTFLWTFIRDPKSQMISNLFFSWKVQIANGHDPTINNLKTFIKANYMKQLEYVAINKEKIKDRLSSEAEKRILFQEILDGFDFLGVSERFDESLVALRFMLGLDAGDLLHVNAKKSGAYHYQNGNCTKIPPKHTFEKQDEYFNSKQFKERIRPINEFYQAVNRSLDLTIERIGHDKFNKALAEHKRLMALADETCSPRAIFPCTDEGIPQLDISEHNCYYKDHGCAYPCLDELYYNVSNNIPMQQ